jgi:hypothetical protein
MEENLGMIFVHSTLVIVKPIPVSAANNWIESALGTRTVAASSSMKGLRVRLLALG